MSAPTEAASFRDLTSQQKKSGLAAWLGWMFDGLDMHIYTLVATPFVAQLLALPRTDKQVGEKGRSSMPPSWSVGPWVVPSSAAWATCSGAAGPCA